MMLNRFLSSLILLILGPVFASIALISLSFYGRPLLFKSHRVGHDGKLFLLIKFRSLPSHTQIVDTNRLKNLQPMGRFAGLVRKRHLDELPQLFNVILGDMNLIGWRPCLGNESELIRLRWRSGIFETRPGITGLAQVLGGNSLTLRRKVAVERLYRVRCARGFREKLQLDLYIVVKTLSRLWVG